MSTRAARQREQKHVRHRRIRRAISYYQGTCRGATFRAREQYQVSAQLRIARDTVLAQYEAYRISPMGQLTGCSKHTCELCTKLSCGIMAELHQINKASLASNRLCHAAERLAEEAQSAVHTLLTATRRKKVGSAYSDSLPWESRVAALQVIAEGTMAGWFLRKAGKL